MPLPPARSLNGLLPLRLLSFDLGIFPILIAKVQNVAALLPDVELPLGQKNG